MAGNTTTATLKYGFNDLCAEGFKQKRLRWCRIGTRTTHIVELQHSSYSKRYFINVGIIIHDIEKLPCGPVRKSHIYGRWGNHDAERALTFDNELSDDTRIQTLEAAVKSELIPLLRSLDSQLELGKVPGNPLSTVLMLPVVRDWLERQ